MLGCSAVLVDLEQSDKADRQAGFDTQISRNSIVDLRLVRQQTDLSVICRVDRQRSIDKVLISQIIEAGADELLIAMVEEPDELEAVMEFVGNEIKVGIMIETVRAVAACKELASLSPERVFLGLNDLWIERHTNSRFDALIDGTADAVAEACGTIAFGVGGATHPDLGDPLAAIHLINEINRLQADFTFLRRSFFDACIRSDAGEVVAAIKRSFVEASSRSEQQVHADYLAARAAIGVLAKSPGYER
ncbi:MAG: aldolase [Acidimicrobiaceae bacterium]|nr:aldolase [Acidimicrobiaceae bacterium]